MCSAADDPTQYDIPEPQPPRVYRLAGDAPVEGPGSVALAALGDLLTRVEDEYRRSNYDPDVRIAMMALREARDRVAKAEHDAR
jgi:hypothetical protein